MDPQTPDNDGAPASGAGLHTNGLEAASFRLLAEVDPRISHELLTLLARQGIAAYSLPSTGQSGVYLDRRLPNRPMDSFYVDAERHAHARSIADPVLTQHTAQTEAAEFEAIVAGLRMENDSDQLTAERANELFAEPDNFGPPPSPVSSARVEPLDFDAIRLGPRDYEPAPEDDHYVPPDPAPRSRPLHQHTKWAILSMVVGLILLLSPKLIGVDGGDGPILFGTIGILIGVVLLVGRLRDDTQEPHDGDDGAVV